MKYNSPYGSADLNAGYCNEDGSAGVDGSIVPAEAIEHPMREIVNVIERAGYVPSAKNLSQLYEAINTIADSKVTPVEFATTDEDVAGQRDNLASTPKGVAAAIAARLPNLSTLLEKSKNLADVPNKTIARRNLGIEAQILAWVRFTSSGHVSGSFNVSSVERSSNGDYTVRFANSLPPNHCFLTSAVKRTQDTNTNNLTVVNVRSVGDDKVTAVRLVAKYAQGGGILENTNPGFVYLAVIGS